MRLLNLLIALGLCLFLIFVFSGASAFSLAAFNPLEAIYGVAFTFAFGFGVPEWLAFALAVGLIFGLPLALWLGLNRWFGRG
ncbi:hypothetical protein AB8Q18_04240 [Neisseriaceae bacterium CLB008]